MSQDYNMPYPKFILNSLKESFMSIWKNKLLFIGLFILQIIFFAVLSSISYNYITKILTNAKGITDYVSQQKLDEASVASNILNQKNILGDEPLSISRNFNEMKKNFKIYLINIFLLLAIFMSLVWSITQRLIHNINLKKFTGIFLKNLVVLIFFLGLIFTFFLLLFDISLTGIAEQSTKILTRFIPFMIFLVIFAYFIFISIPLSFSTGLGNIVQRTLIFGVRKIHYILTVYLVNILLIALSLILLYFFIEKSLLILLFSIALLTFSFIFGRIFLMVVINKLTKSKRKLL